MKIVFFGTPDYVLPVLESLHKAFKTKNGESPIVAVVTRKPKPVGRKKILTCSLIDKWAHKKNIPVFYDPNDLTKNHITADVGILASYGNIIPKFVIGHFKFGIINIHPSLLPKYRGASPVQAAIISGDKQTGVSIIKLDEKLDHGPIISQFTEDILKNDTSEALRKRLFEKSAESLVALIPSYIKGKIKLREQNHKLATFTRQLKKSDAFIPPKFLKIAMSNRIASGSDPEANLWEIPFMKTKSSQASLIKNYSLVPSAYSLERFIRSMQPWPIAWTLVRLNPSGQAKRLKILKAHVESDIRLQTSDVSQKLVLDQVQLEGKNPVSWKQFKQGYCNLSFDLTY